MVGPLLHNGVQLGHVFGWNVPRRLIRLAQAVAIRRGPIIDAVVVGFDQGEFADWVQAIGGARGIGRGLGGHMRRQHRIANTAIGDDLAAQRFPVVARGEGGDFFDIAVAGIQRQPAFGPARLVHPWRIAQLFAQLQAGAQQVVVMALGDVVDELFACGLGIALAVFGHQMRQPQNANARIQTIARGHAHLRQLVMRQMDAFVDHQQGVISHFGVLRFRGDVVHADAGQVAGGHLAGVRIVCIQLGDVLVRFCR